MAAAVYAPNVIKGGMSLIVNARNANAVVTLVYQQGR